MTDDSRYKKCKIISWSRLQSDCRILSEKLMDVRQDWDKIVAVARGGIIPAGLLAREMSIHIVDTVSISSYETRNQGDINILKGSDGIQADERTIVIDDLSDSGNTARTLKKMFPNSFLATLYTKPAGTAYPDLSLEEFTQDTWVLFPWDSREDIRFVAPVVPDSKQ